MRRRLQKGRLILVVSLLVLLVAAVTYLVFRRVSADVNSVNYPSWMDSQVVDRASHYWSVQQTAQLRQIISAAGNGCGLTSQISPNSQELSLLGSGVKVFSARTAQLNSPINGNGFYSDQFRVAIAAFPISMTNAPWGNAHYKVAIGNNTNHTVYLNEATLRISIAGADSSNPTVPMNIGNADLVFNNGRPLALNPGDYSVADTGSFRIGADYGAYTIIYFGTRIYSTNSAGNVTWGGTGASLVNCFPDPFNIKTLGGGAISFSQAAVPSPTWTPPQSSTPTPLRPTPTVTVSTSPVISPTATISPGVIGSLVKMVSFPNRFSVFGNTKTLSSQIFSNAGLYLIKFDGVNNRWITSPNPDSFDATSFEGYYVYNPSAEKSIAIPYELAVIDSYKVTKGWNMLWSGNDRTRSQLKLEIDNQVQTLDQWVAAGKVDEKVFIIDDDRSSEACTYFKLLTASDSPANCSNQTLGTSSRIPAGKDFWVRVNG